MSDEDFLRVVARHLDGDLDAGEREILAARLRTDAAARRTYRDLLAMDSLLRADAKERLSDTARHALRVVTTRRPRTRSRRTRRTRSAAPGWMWGGIAAAVAAVIVVVVSLGRSAAPSAQVTASPTTAFQARVEGAVSVVRAGVVVPQTDVQSGDVIAAQAAAQVIFPDGARIALTSGTRLRLDADQSHAQGARLHLHSGSAQSILPAQPRGFALSTDLGTITVLGTTFTTSAEPGRTRIAVEVGRVSVRAGGQQRILQSGDRVDITGAGMQVERAGAGTATPTVGAAAQFPDPTAWIARGPLSADVAIGQLRFPEGHHQPIGFPWSGRSWQWHQRITPADHGTLRGVLSLPEGAGAANWQAELFLADANTTFDREEGQPADCLRLLVRDRRVQVQQLDGGPDALQVAWRAADRLTADQVALALAYGEGTVRALVDGVEVWQAPIPYASSVIGIRFTRRHDDPESVVPVMWDQVTLSTAR